jgi:hypothetical protein
MKLSNKLKYLFSFACLTIISGCGHSNTISGVTQYTSVLKPSATHFSEIGHKASFQWAPPNYNDNAHPGNFSYDIFYYIPASIQRHSKVNALIFNHGGGSSTLTRDGAIAAVNLYIDDLVAIADQLGCIVVLPSSNGLNWGGHTVGIMTALSKLMRDELDIDPQHLGLSGHSMGGMGITRSYWQLADQFAFFLPQASGMDLSYASDSVTEWQLNKVFNVAYTQLEGTHDSFDVFVTRGEDQLRRTEDLEAKYGVPSKLQMIFYNTTHNYRMGAFKYYLNDSFQTVRDLYQPELFGTYSTGSDWRTENNISFPYTPSSRYFWVEAIPDTTVASPVERINFHAKIANNTITMEYPVIPVHHHQIRIFLHSQMVDLTKPVNVLINGVLVGTRDPFFGVDILRSMDPTDPSFEYEDVMTVDLPSTPANPVYPTPTPDPSDTPTPSPAPTATPAPSPTATPDPTIPGPVGTPAQTVPTPSPAPLT